MKSLKQKAYSSFGIWRYIQVNNMIGGPFFDFFYIKKTTTLHNYCFNSNSFFLISARLYHGTIEGSKPLKKQRKLLHSLHNPTS